MIYQASRATGRSRRPWPPAWWRHALTALVLVAYAWAGGAGARALWARREAARAEQRGVSYGLAAAMRQGGVDPWGINVALEQYGDEPALARSLDLLVAGGFHTVRQRFCWEEIEPARGEWRWERWDAIVQQCQARGLRILAVLDGSPAWARRPEDSANPFAPPRNPADYATFARALALRYGAAIDDYQIWDEPNIYPHWGEHDADPAGYLALAAAARTQIRAVDPGATIVAAGLAPNTEAGGRNLNDVLYLRGLYTAGGRDLFDVIAAKPLGFWSGPEDRRVDPGVLNYSRVVALHEEMVRQGDAFKPLWAVAWGWNALPPDWAGRPSPWGSDTASKQEDRDLRAIERAREEWPWLQLMCYAAWQPATPVDDPVWGFSLLDPQGVPGTLYGKLQALARRPEVLYPGRHALPGAASTTAATRAVRFWGSRLDVAGASGWRLLELDGRPAARRVGAVTGPAAVVRGLPAGEHEVLLQPSQPAANAELVVSRDRPPLITTRTALAAVALSILATVVLWQLLRPYPWRSWAQRALGWYAGLSPWAGFGLGVGALGLLALAPNLALSLLALGAVGLLTLGRGDVGLMLAVSLVPLAPLMKQFGPAQFSYLEMVTLLALGGYLWRAAAEGVRGWRERSAGSGAWQAVRRAVGHIDALDIGFGLLVAASLLSLGVSDHLRVSLRELRVVVLQAGFLYWLVSRGRLDREGVLRLADVLVLSAAAISLQGLYQYTFTEQTILAEGVRRVRGIYGSPNNLALVLERLLPVMLATVLRAPRGRRRWAYGLAALPAVLCLFLTFSKGAWILGIPASLLALGLLAGRRARVAAVALGAAGLLALVPLLGTARVGSLFSLQGTSLLRIKLWEASWDMVRDHPWLGVGLDNFLYHYPSYIRPEAMSEPNLSHPHNIVLDFWLRLGLGGLAALGWLVWSYFRRGLALWRRHEDAALWSLSIGLVAGMAGALAHGLVDASFFVVELGGLAAVMAGLVRRMAELSGSGR